MPRLPDQSPDAVQPSALVLDQLSVVESPDDTLVGFAESVTSGAAGGAAPTETVTESLALPPAPLQVRI
ncbi:MAG: hypothetical protein PVJ78_06510 [Gammaproteobacteria bacterium]